MSRWIKITITVVGIAAPALMLFQNFTYVSVNDLTGLTANPCSLQEAAFAALTQESAESVPEDTLKSFTTLESAFVGKPQVVRRGTTIRVSQPDATLWVNGESRGKVAQVQSGDAVQIELRTADKKMDRCSLGFAALNGHVIVWQQNLDLNRKPAFASK